jgi:hypothetical protein
MSNIVKMSDKRPRSVAEHLRQVADSYIDKNQALESAVLVLSTPNEGYAYHLIGDYLSLSMLGALAMLKNNMIEQFESSEPE